MIEMNCLNLSCAPNRLTPLLLVISTPRLISNATYFPLARTDFQSGLGPSLHYPLGSHIAAYVVWHRRIASPVEYRKRLDLLPGRPLFSFWNGGCVGCGTTLVHILVCGIPGAARNSSAYHLTLAPSTSFSSAKLAPASR